MDVKAGYPSNPMIGIGEGINWVGGAIFAPRLVGCGTVFMPGRQAQAPLGGKV